VVTLCGGPWENLLVNILHFGALQVRRCAPVTDYWASDIALIVVVPYVLDVSYIGEDMRILT